MRKGELSMNYELEFISINEDSCDADAICMRFFDKERGRYIIGVYDGGTQKYGNALVSHLTKYYFQNTKNPTIDFIVCSHTDQDHASGLCELFDHFHVGALIVNRPWLYIDDIFDKVTDGRITKSSLENRLKQAYPYVSALEEKALKNNTPIYEGFQGTTIYKQLKILSPTKEFYKSLLVESSKTPLSENSVAQDSFFTRILNEAKTTLESWTNELLREKVSTSPENEASIVLLGDMVEEQFLLTGDAGIRALRQSIDYASKTGIDIRRIKVHQIPHHGGRHNVSPSILDALLGKKIVKGTTPTKYAFVSVGKGTNHPQKMVTNAYMRRGAKVYEARTHTVRHQNGMTSRSGWTTTTPIAFSEKVEDWD